MGEKKGSSQVGRVSVQPTLRRVRLALALQNVAEPLWGTVWLDTGKNAGGKAPSKIRHNQPEGVTDYQRQ